MASRPTSGTSSRSSKSSAGAETRAHSAVHVVRGAIEKTLGPRRFDSAQTDGASGNLKLTFTRPLLPQEVAKIGAAANRKVAEDAEVLEFEMDAEEAEGHFGKGIYDLCAAPAQKRLNIVRIPEWGAACCSSRHVSSTGLIGAIKIDGTNFDQGRGELTVTFHLQ